MIIRSLLFLLHLVHFQDFPPVLSTSQRLHLLRLGLKGEQLVDPGIIPSAEEIRKEMNRYIPESEKLSDLVTAMREE